MQFNEVTGTFQEQDVELDKLFIDVACYNNRMMSGAHMESAIDLQSPLASPSGWATNGEIFSAGT